MSELVQVYKSSDVVIYSSAALKFFQNLVDNKRLIGYLVFNDKKELVSDTERETVYKIKKGITFEETAPYRRLALHQPTLLKIWSEQKTYNFSISDRICQLERLKVPFDKIDKESLKIQESPRWLLVDTKLIEARLRVIYGENLGIDTGTITVEGSFDSLFNIFFDYARGKSSLKS